MQKGNKAMTSKYEYYRDSQGISHIKYTFAQGIEHLLLGIVERIQRVANLRPFLLPKTYKVSSTFDPEWVIGEFKVGWNGGDSPYDFLVKVRLPNWIGEREPNTWDSILWTCDRLLPTALRLLRLTCYTPDGYYIGDIKTAARLYYGWKLINLQPFSVPAGKDTDEYCKDQNIPCSIGFDPENQKWIGWSHRAAGAFGVGHIVEKGNCEASSGYTEEYLEEHHDDDISVPVGFEVKTLKDAKRCAIAFAESVD